MENTFDPRTLKMQDRRVIVVASKDDIPELYNTLNLNPIVVAAAPLASAIVAKAVMPLFLIGPVGWVALAGGLLVDILGKKKTSGKVPYPVIDINTARNYYKFPINHPQSLITYASCDAEPDTYVPFADFHRYMYQYKLTAFQELCCNLGVKRCSVLYDQGEETKSAGHAGASIPGNSFNVSASKERSMSERTKILLELPELKKAPNETHTLWMVGEPTWNSMQKLRLERGITKYQVEFTYKDDMGVTAEAAAKISGMGFNIGGSFSKAKHVDLVYDVEFWPSAK